VNKRVLIVGYFYLDANMGGVRLRRIARLLPRHGWEPVVLTHPRAADSVAGVGQGVRSEEVAAPDLTKAYSRLRQWRRGQPPASGSAPLKAKEIGLTREINRWLMVPDKQVPWYGPALRRGRELIEREKFAALFASVEPRTCALVAARLSRQTGIPCVIEYRDLWTGNPYYHITQPTRLHHWLHARLERKVLRQTRRVSAVCRGIAEFLTRQYGSVLQAPVELNYNFFDPEEYPAEFTRPAGPRPFTVSYTGAMYASRTPHQFFEGARRFIEQTRLTPAQFRFRWAGAAAGIKDLDEALDRAGLRQHLDYLGQLEHRQALRLLMESDVALLIQAPGDVIHIPGKLFEALGAGVPLLALAHPCEATDIIRRCRAGIVCPHTAESVAAALMELHRLSGQGKRWDFNDAEVQRFAADAAVGRLAALFDQASA
jgi:glycosyltransferase involved in cell wall biosynthesis